MAELADDDDRRQKLLAARKKLKNFRASRSSRSSAPSDHSPSASTSAAAAAVPLVSSTAGNTPLPGHMHARSASRSKSDKAAVHRHRRSASRSISISAAVPAATVPQHRASSSLSRAARGSVVGLFDAPDAAGLGEITMTPATPLLDSAFEPYTGDDAQAKERLSTFSFGKPAPASPASPTRATGRRSLASFNINDPTPFAASPSALGTPGSRPPSLLLTAASPLPLGSPSSSRRQSLAASPTPSASPQPTTPQRRRHSHSRSESISLPNLKVGRPTSLVVPSTSPAPASPSSPLSGSEGRARPVGSVNGTRLKFEPSGRGAEADREREEYRRRALEQLTGATRRESVPPLHGIALPEFDETPTLPSLAAVAEAAAAGLAASPIPFDDDAGFAFPTRADDNVPAFSTDTADIPLPTASTRASLGVLTEEDENEDDAASPLVDSRPTTDDDEQHGAVPLAGLKALHLVSSSKRDSTDALRSFAFPHAEPAPHYGAIGRGRPRPLSSLTTASTNSVGSLGSMATTTSSPATAIVTPRSATSAAPRRRRSRGSSISYRKDGESFGASASVAGSRDWSVGRASPTFDGHALSPTALASPRLPWAAAPAVPRASGSARPCPRPRSLIGLGLGPARVLDELDEADEDKPAAGVDVGRDASVLDVSGLHDLEHQDWATSRDRIDLELERDALRDDVELWKGRCRTLEERLESERKESALLRDRVRKLGDRLLTFSAANPARPPTPAELRAQQESRLIGEMRAQLLAVSAALERERRARADAEARLGAAGPAESDDADDQAWPAPAPLAAFKPALPSALLASVPEHDPRAQQPHVPVAAPAAPSHPPAAAPDPNAGKLRAWGFPSGPTPTTTSRADKRESFFGLSASPLPAAPPSPYGLGRAVGIDLPPIPVPGAPAPRAVSAAAAPPVVLVAPTESWGQRAVSAPHVPAAPAAGPDGGAARSAGGLGFLAHYLGRKDTAAAGGARPDFAHACRKCVGELIEL